MNWPFFCLEGEHECDQIDGSGVCPDCQQEMAVQSPDDDASEEEEHDHAA